MLTRLLVLLVAFDLSAATLNSNGSASDTQSKINSASNGDTVLLPSGGSYTWSASVEMPSSKYITLDLNGSTVTISGSGITFQIDGHATGLNRVTNGSVVRGSGFNQYQGPFQVAGDGVRVDHITFTGSDVLVDIWSTGSGVMDHCTFSGLDGAQEFIHVNGYGAGNTTGWSVDVYPGSDDMFYFEDCTFTTSSGEANCAWIQGYYGCRVAFRYNLFNYVSVDMHGTAGNVGARWWEGYNNTFTNTASQNQHWTFSMRAGSGVLFNNASVGGRTLNIGLCEEDTGYPALYQIGRGKNQALDPVYAWGNTGGTEVSINSCDAPEVDGMVQLNRDVYESARPGYSAYTYPHPLAGGEEPPAEPSTNRTASATSARVGTIQFR